jgi:hypothetical protein
MGQCELLRAEALDLGPFFVSLCQRTSENQIQEKFAELLIHTLR